MVWNDDESGCDSVGDGLDGDGGVDGGDDVAGDSGGDGDGDVRSSKQSCGHRGSCCQIVFVTVMEMIAARSKPHNRAHPILIRFKPTLQPTYEGPIQANTTKNQVLCNSIPTCVFHNI